MRPASPAARRLGLLALLLAYPPLWLLLEALSTPLAFWPVVARFLLVWWLPVRWWPALLLADASGALVARHLYHGAPLAGIGPWALAFLPILGYMAVVALARWWTRLAEPDAPARMGLLLGACLLSSLLVSPVLVLNAGSTMLGSELGARRLLDFALGDYFALMVLVPFACALRAGRLGELARRQRLLELLLGLLVAIALLRLGQAQPALLPSLQLLAFVPLMLVAFRHGWVGAATALAGLGLAIAYGLTGPEVAAELHARSAVLGSAALMLGAAASQLARQREALEAQHASLRLAMLEQQSLAERIVRLEEAGQREVAEALHGRVAPPLASLRTQLAMAWQALGGQGDGRLLDSLRDQCWQVQDGLERVLRRLQPPAIDQRPLAELLAHGPLWEWAQEAGARWQAGVDPAAQTLPARWKALLYRIAQAGLQQGLAAGGRDFRLRLETRPLAGRYAVELALDIEAPAGLAANDPIEAIRDRVTAAGGQYTARREDGCWQHRARFEIQSL
ncbi:hypothetical protein [Silanimonas lenta]|uniref:hypothetical protein n=1 Tax=Silanimonas lenta TaxID=265429 RepID=UPI002FE03D93